MAVHTFKVTQKLNASIETVWDFMSSPQNLRQITPPEMGFEIQSKDLSPKIYRGMMIQYKVRPLMGIPVTWLTEITHVEQGVYFVDEQRVGPYALWHHEHHLESFGQQTLMTDLIHYQIPMGPLGDLMNILFIRKKLQGIFDYRFKFLERKYE